MGKTVGKILEVGAIGAAAFVLGGTGIGLALGYSLGASISYAVAGLGALTGLGTTAAGGLALAGASIEANRILGPKLEKPEQSVTALKAPADPYLSRPAFTSTAEISNFKADRAKRVYG